MGFDWLSAPLWIGGVLLVLVAARYAVVLELLLRLRFDRGGSIPLQRQEVPRRVREILDVPARQLADFGFEYRISQAIRDGLVSTRDKPLFADLYVHPNEHCHAAVTPAEEPEPGAVCAVEFLTCYADGRQLTTLNRRLHTIPALPPDWLAEDRYLAGLDEQWALHRERMAALGGAEPVDDPLEPWRRSARLRAGYREHLVALGLARPVPGQDVWRFTLRGAWRFLRGLTEGARRAARTRPKPVGESPRVLALADAFAFGRSVAAADNAPANRPVRLLLFVASALAGALAFGVALSWQIVPALLGVLLFHELGHLAAMRLAGYRDLGVFVVPLLGAVATGRKDDATPWQRVFVYLAGPVPGLVLGAACLHYAFRMDGDLQFWLLQVGAMALALNLFNLLPFVPLDGGRVVETLLFVRFPRLRAAFVAVSAALLLAGGILLGDWVLTLVGVLVTLALPAELRVAGLVGALAERRASLAGRRGKAARAVFGALAASGRSARLGFQARVRLAKSALALLAQRAPRPIESILGLALYAAATVLPLASLLASEPMLMLAGSAAIASAGIGGPTAAAVPPPDWEARLVSAADDAARWQASFEAGRWHEDAEDTVQARRWFRRALDAAAAFPPEDLRVLDAKIALARTADEGADPVRLYREVLPAVERLQGPDRLRLAEVLEALHYAKPELPAAARIARLETALAVRESLPEMADYRIYGTRRELAGLLDRAGETGRAEALLRENALPQSGAREAGFGLQTMARRELAWFLIAHDRAAEAETLLAHVVAALDEDGSAVQAEDGLPVALAWAQLAQGRGEEAEETLRGLLERPAHQGAPMGSAARLDILLDLAEVAHRRGDREAEAKWLARAGEMLRALPAPVAENLRTHRYRAQAEAGQAWEAARWQRHAELAARL